MINYENCILQWKVQDKNPADIKRDIQIMDYQEVVRKGLPGMAKAPSADAEDRMAIGICTP